MDQSQKSLTYQQHTCSTFWDEVNAGRRMSLHLQFCGNVQYSPSAADTLARRLLGEPSNHTFHEDQQATKAREDAKHQSNDEDSSACNVCNDVTM